MTKLQVSTDAKTDNTQVTITTEPEQNNALRENEVVLTIMEALHDAPPLTGRSDAGLIMPERDEKGRKIKTAEQIKYEEQILREVLASVGLDACEDEMREPEPPGFNWDTIKCAGTAQMVLAGIAILCMTPSIIFGATSVYSFSGGIWTVFVFLTGCMARRAAHNKSHSAATAYTLMVSFQTLMSLATMCVLVYLGYSIDIRVRNHRHALLLTATTVVEAGALLLTIVTGLIGMRASCVGIGRLLAAQEAHVVNVRVLAYNYLSAHHQY